MNGYVRIQGMGATLSDVLFEYIGLWIQTLIYSSFGFRLRA